MLKDTLKQRLPDVWQRRLRPFWQSWKHRPRLLQSFSTDDPIFVVGHPRSGTSWLYKLLASHPSLAGGPESHLFDYYLKPFLEKDPYWPWGGLHYWLSDERRSQLLRKIVDEVFSYRAAEMEGKRVVEKTPEHALHIKTIKELCPRAQFIHIVRDGRDVMLSVLAYEHLPNRPRSIEEAAQQWCVTLSAVDDSQGLHPSDILEVRYEDLVAAPKQHLAQIFTFAGISFSEALIERIVRESPPSQSSIGKWRSKLSAEEAASFERTAQQWLRRMNYEVQPRK